MAQKRSFADLAFECNQAVALPLQLLILLGREHFADVGVRPKPDLVLVHDFFEARGQVDFCLIGERQQVSLLVLFAPG